jgi:imidazolonepropionase-like amidohydrolase
MMPLAIASLAFLSACSNPQGLVEEVGDLVLRGGTLIDGTGAAPLVDGAVVIQNDRITWVGKSDSAPIPEGATVMNLDGASILPGFVNAHVHGGFQESNLKAWAREGVTTVRDLGARFHAGLFPNRDALNADPSNARLVAAGPMVTVPGGYPSVPWGSASAYPVASVQEARQEAGEILDTGANLIKIALERGDVFGTVIPVLSSEMAQEIVRVAHERGTVVSAHITAARDLELALAAGVDDVAHMAVTHVSDDVIEQLVSRGIYWVPTLELWNGVGGGNLAAAQGNLSRFVSAGGTVALGTDFAGYSAPFDLGMPIREAGWMEEAGMTPMQVIVAATRNAAYLCNMEDELGTLEAGKVADLLVVNGNPLDDLTTVLADVRLVIHNGVVIRDAR